VGWNTIAQVPSFSATYFLRLFISRQIRYKKTPASLVQRTTPTDMGGGLGAKKTAIARRTACQSPNSGCFSPSPSPVRPRNEVPATPRAPYMLLEDTYRISPIDTRYAIYSLLWRLPQPCAQGCAMAPEAIS
jgi:hypothetical protein